MVDYVTLFHERARAHAAPVLPADPKRAAHHSVHYAVTFTARLFGAFITTFFLHFYCLHLIGVFGRIDGFHFEGYEMNLWDQVDVFLVCYIWEYKEKRKIEG